MKIINAFRFVSYLKREKACVFKTIKYNFLSKHIVSNNHGRVIIYPKTILYFEKGSRIMLDNEYVHLGKRHFFDGDGLTSIKLLKNSEWESYGLSYIYQGSVVIVEEDAFLKTKAMDTNYGSIIRCAKAITFGDKTLIGRNVYICDSDHHGIKIDGTLKEDKKAIVIGDKVWVGANSTILKGVTIGNNVVIGANTLVTKDVPSNSMLINKVNPVIVNKVEWEE